MFPRYFLAFFLFVLSVNNVFALTQPKFTIIPTTATSFSITPDDSIIVQYRVTNKTAITRKLTMVPIIGFAQLTNGTGFCKNTFTLAHDQSCLLTLQAYGSKLTMGTTTQAVTVCKTNVNNNAPDSFLCSKTNGNDNIRISVSPSIAPLSVIPDTITLIAGGVSRQFNVTNLSSTTTATNVRGILTGTALNGNVTENSSNCVSLPPGQTCNLIFTPGNTDVSLTSFPIKGDNTTIPSASIEIVSASFADISISGSPLALTVGGSSGEIVVTNNSTTVTATDIQATLSPEVAAAVTQNASGCTTVSPGHSCSLVFTPNSTVLAPKIIEIQGTNTLQKLAVIAVNRELPSLAYISVSPRTLNLTAGGASGTLTVMNSSSSIITASDIQGILTGTSLNGNVTQNSSACTSVAPGGSCNLVFTPGNTAVAATPFRIQGDNTTPSPAVIQISAPSKADISVSGSPLTLTAGGSSGDLTITNNSTTITATNVQATLSGQVAAAVTQDASACTSLSPGDSCNLVFTPNTTTLDPTTITIEGTNTSQTSAVISVNPAPSATLVITSGSPLVLPANGVTTGTMTITNTSSTVTATNVIADFSNTNLNGKVNATTCSSISPNSSCTMTFTPGITTAVSTSFPIYGANTETVNGQIGISSYFAYIATPGSSVILICNVSLIDGTISNCTSVTAVNSGISGIAFNSNNTYAYIAVSNPPGVQACVVNPYLGSLSNCITTTIYTTGTLQSEGIVYNPQLNLLYVGISNYTVFTCLLNSNGTIASCYNSGAYNMTNPKGLAINPASNLVYITNYSGSGSVTQCSVDPTTGSLSSSCSLSYGLGNSNFGIAVNSTNTFAYISNGSANSVNWGAINSSDGSLTPAGSLAVSSSWATGLALNAVTNSFYVNSYNTNAVIQCSVDETTGAISGCFTTTLPGVGPYAIGLYPTPP